jgi:hypothetical protein
MKISQDFTKLKKENSLVIVTGTHLAKVFEVRKGKILKKPTVHIEETKLTDNGGSESEQKDNNLQIDFRHALTKELKDILDVEKDIGAIYIFSPSSTIKNVKAMLPKINQKDIAFEYTGNFTKFTAEELLEKIQLKRISEIRKTEKLLPETKKILTRQKIKNNQR